MQITAMDEFVAQCEAKGVQRDVSLFMMMSEPLEVGDYVLVHVGYAIQKITAEEAQSSWDLIDDALAAIDEADARQGAVSHV
jgi:hydrogenase expression/formation protein HypC